MNLSLIYFSFPGLQPRERGVGLRDVPRRRGGDALLHRHRLRHVQDRHQYKGHPINEGLRQNTKKSNLFIMTFQTS